MSESYSGSRWKAFAETVANALTGKEYCVVALGAATGTAPNQEPTVQLWTGSDSSPAIGVCWGKVQPLDTQVSVYLFGDTMKFIASGAIAYGARVIPTGSAGQVATSSGSNVRSLGIKLTPGTSAAGDIIEVLMIVEPNGTFAN
jgi:hypothetical protein